MGKKEEDNNYISYADYRKEREMLAYEKQKLLTLVARKKQAFREYNDAYKKYCSDLSLKYRELTEQEEQQRQKLIGLIPTPI